MNPAEENALEVPNNFHCNTITTRIVIENALKIMTENKDHELCIFSWSIGNYNLFNP